MDVPSLRRRMPSGLRSIEAAVVVAALPNTFSAAAHSPKYNFRSSTSNSERTILMDILTHEKYACVAGAKATLPAAAKIITDVTAQVMAAHVTLIVGGKNISHSGQRLALRIMPHQRSLPL